MDVAEKKSIVLPCIAGIFCMLSLFLIGWSAPVFMKMYRDFGIDPLPPRLRVISVIHWFWTLPLGVLVTTGLIWSSRRRSRKTTLLIDTAAIALAILVFAAFFFALFQPTVGPMRTMKKTAEPTSAGDVANRAAPEK